MIVNTGNATYTKNKTLPQIGEGLYHLKTHSFCQYDINIDTMQPLERNVAEIVAAWKDHIRYTNK